LSLEECATLAGIVKNPYSYNPVNFPDKCKERRNNVLWAMQDQGKISEAEANALYDKDIVLVDADTEEEDSTDNTAIFNWYTEAVFNEVQEDLMEQYGYSKYSAGMAIYTGGLKIYTCMDPEVQSVLEEIYTNDEEYFPMANSSMQPESAMVIVDPYTGDVLGLVGGRGEKVSNRILNRATGTLRPPGSSIKPVSVYAPALDAGIISYASVYDDVPVNFGTNAENPKAWPGNLPYVYRGLTNVNSAIERSVNTVAVRVLQDLTPEASYKFVTEELGFSTVYDKITTASGAVMSDIDLSPLALGQLTYGISVKEITASYSIFQNSGVFNNPRLYTKVVNSNNETILTCDRETNIVISEQSASIMTKMLYNVVNDPEGTAVGNITLKNSVDVAGKTGTSTADFDRWFVGYTPYYVGGCWVGYDTNIALSAFGPNPACLIWDKVMTKLHQKYIDAAANGGEALKTFENAPGVIEATFCKDSGKLITDACRLDLRGDRSETGWFAYGTEPSEYCDCHVKVKYCNDYNLVASPKCRNTREISLVRIENRSFPIEMTVWDAQYAYRDLPENIVPGGWWGEPFFGNMLKDGEYCGTSDVATLANAYC
ncbi:MAG: transglycosylase domain-containing protein, partial [Clostridia bacterium]|nr:transglycosylase domain-containing protein [Clostridia bacterium]